MLLTPLHGILTGHLGSKALTAIRGVLCEAPVRTHSSAPAGQAGQRHDYLRGQLSATAAARYREFVQSLAGSMIPFEALDTIMAALNAEPVPPADPMLTLLQETAGEHGLLEHYRSTHTNAAS